MTGQNKELGYFKKRYGVFLMYYNGYDSQGTIKPER
ncbi:Hypothetical protein BSM4216_1037 [Bacillus smithii]|nr:Hypothetical protein BSM4216_1037 [Bacillus smithii]